MPLLVRENFLLSFDYHVPASSNGRKDILFIHSSHTEQSSTTLSRLTTLYPDNRFSFIEKEGAHFPEDNMHELDTLTYRETCLPPDFHLAKANEFGLTFFCVNMEIDVIANKEKPEGSFEEVEFEEIESKLRERYGNILRFLENTRLKANTYVIDKNFQVWRLTHRDIEACSGRWQINGDSFFLPSTALTLKEGEELFELGRFGPSEGAIVNIGNFLGGSSILLSKGSKKENREKVYSFDPKVYPLEKNYLHENQVEDWIIFNQSTSENGIQEWEKRADKRIRLLFIDGDHSYKGCHNDISLWSRYLVSGGVIAIHDYCLFNSDRNFHEVVKAVYDTVLSKGGFHDFRREDYLFLANKK